MVKEIIAVSQFNKSNTKRQIGKNRETSGQVGGAVACSVKRFKFPEDASRFIRRESEKKQRANLISIHYFWLVKRCGNFYISVGTAETGESVGKRASPKERQIWPH
ncbi:hypothetical protein GWI33_000165 [Rhynchophorus ferrugineus]|uniref:Uncharacterized protein n=1 Tax=Rhynchophorus ferrugineus TaxID=354439 RepID=A0A834IWS2_RHYFE|nr:hypothetical protein GWI33_000165 [Rhynchophorus ferrugineus]